MKINVFAETDGGGFKAIGLESELFGNQVLEDDIIESIDKDRETPKQKAKKFLSFLNSKGLDMVRFLEVLSAKEQQELKVEFLED